MDFHSLSFLLGQLLFLQYRGSPASSYRQILTNLVQSGRKRQGKSEVDGLPLLCSSRPARAPREPETDRQKGAVQEKPECSFLSEEKAPPALVSTSVAGWYVPP